MIITLTLNPAVDKTIEINNFQVNGVNRVISSRQDPGGKGINVSKVVQVLGEENIAFGILGGRTGEYIREMLDLWRIKHRFIAISRDTRTNIKIVDKQKSYNTEINETGPEVSKEVLDILLNDMFAIMNKNDILVLSGSVPENIHKTIYKDIIYKAKSKGAITILDADGELLKEGIKAGPFLVKPNIQELEKLFGRKICDENDAIELAKEILKFGVGNVVISMGEKGSIFLNNKLIIVAEGLKVDVKSTVGAGDSMVAAIAVAIHRGYSIEDTVKLSMATSAASVTTSGTQPGDMEMIQQLKSQVSYYKTKWEGL